MRMKDFTSRNAFVALGERKYNPRQTLPHAASRGRRRERRDSPMVTSREDSPVISTRPKIAELVYQLYARSLHPELFDTHQSRTVERGGYRATIQITSAGHVVSWQYGGLTLTEVAAGAQHPLPKLRRLMSYRLKGDRTDRLEIRPCVSYDTHFSLEPADR
jgi:hypothetical protein